MKKVIITKDEYTENTVRVNYFEQNATRKEKKLKGATTFTFYLSGEIGSPEDLFPDMFEEIETVYENLLFSERFKWKNDESELNQEIENRRLQFEEYLNRIN
jgi:hypothetical protein